MQRPTENLHRATPVPTEQYTQRRTQGLMSVESIPEDEEDLESSTAPSTERVCQLLSESHFAYLAFHFSHIQKIYFDIEAIFWISDLRQSSCLQLAGEVLPRHPFFACRQKQEAGRQGYPSCRQDTPAE